MTSAVLAVLLMLTPGRAPAADSARMDFTADIRLFTAYAFMNAAGNDDEWRKEGMHPLRVAVRQELANCCDPELRARMHAFDESHGGSWTLYGDYVLLTSGPPDFRVSYDPASTPDGKELVESRAGLSELMRDFYAAAHVDELWARHRFELQAENDRYQPFGQQAIGDIVDYCRLGRTYFADSTAVIHFQSVPLMLYFTAWTAVVNGERWIVCGPQVGDPGPEMFYHEALHPVINPLLSEHASDVERLSPLLAVAKSKPDVGYGLWPDLVGDCFTRALDKVISARRSHEDPAQLDRRIEAEYRLGFILAPAIAEGLRRYERQGRSFPEYFPTLLRRIDVAKETKRWQEFWNRPEQRSTAPAE